MTEENLKITKKEEAVLLHYHDHTCDECDAVIVEKCTLDGCEEDELCENCQAELQEDMEEQPGEEEEEEAK